MHSTMITLLNRLESPELARTDVIRWGCPVPVFGDLRACRVATVGLNPSRREFLDEFGNELQGRARRFHTLSSLRLASWSDVDFRHIQLMLELCQAYFEHNPYHSWFGRLDRVISGTGSSYYGPSAGACHLDLIPYATAHKWTDLTTKQRTALMSQSADTLGLIIRDSPIQVLVLNGMTVVDQFEVIADGNFKRDRMFNWSLPRKSGVSVAGFAYKTLVKRIGGIDLGRAVIGLGFNHNLQSSFGVTTEVINGIRQWITQATAETLN